MEMEVRRDVHYVKSIAGAGPKKTVKTGPRLFKTNDIAS